MAPSSSDASGQDMDAVMERRGAHAALNVMDAHDHELLERATDRFERRLSEECGALRVETAALRADMNKELGELRADMNKELGELRADMNRELGDLGARMSKGFGDLRADMIERNAELIKWNAAFWVAQLAAMAGLLVLIR
jgi:hypothetical protein